MSSLDGGTLVNAAVAMASPRNPMHAIISTGGNKRNIRNKRNFRKKHLTSQPLDENPRISNPLLAVLPWFQGSTNRRLRDPHLAEEAWLSGMRHLAFRNASNESRPPNHRAGLALSCRTWCHGLRVGANPPNAA